MSTLLRRFAAPAAALLLLIGVGTAAFSLRALDMDMEADSDGDTPIGKSLDEAATQIHRLERHLSGAMGMMGEGMMGMHGQMPMMGQIPTMGMQGQMRMQCMGMMGHMPMTGQVMMGMEGRGPGIGMASTNNPAILAYWEAGHRMHHGMKAALTGEADRDFVTSMIPHHQGAVEMAEIVLKHGSDPEVKKLAEAIIAAQKAETGQLEEWLKMHPQ